VAPMTSPMTKRESLEARKTYSGASSAGWAGRPVGLSSPKGRDLFWREGDGSRVSSGRCHLCSAWHDDVTSARSSVCCRRRSIPAIGLKREGVLGFRVSGCSLGDVKSLRNRRV
jgi:hypothetical protein